jgi:hypothetical protein
MEGNYYLCGWRTLDLGFEVWVLKNPRVKAGGASFNAADEMLAARICDRFGDGESKREYVPSPPLRSGRTRFLVTVWGDDSVDVINATQLFTDGRCSVCRAILGSRTRIPMQTEKLANRQKNGFFASAGHVMHVFSQGFVDLIEDHSGIQLRWQTVVAPGKGKWVELVGGDFVREVVPKRRNLSGWRCSSCGITRILAYRDLEGIRSHVAASDFKKQVPDIFPIKHLRGVSLGMTDKLWAQVRTKPEAKGLMSMAVGLVLDEDISDLSQLRSYQADPQSVPSWDFSF